MLAIGFRGNDHLHPGRLRLLHYGVSVIPFVSNEHLGGNALDQLRSLCAICHGTCRNKDSHRQTMRIHGQMYFGVAPPFVRPMA